MDRRSFFRLCSSALALVGGSPRLLAQSGGVSRHYDRVLLTDRHGKPLKASGLQTGVSYLFHYPFAGTPCFLLDLGKAVESVELKNSIGQAYTWPGGVGGLRSVVSFSAVCSHQLSYPSKQQSFINYTHSQSKIAGRGQVIVCCAHHTVYDPARGAKVIAGPAPKPLTSIILEHDRSTDRLHAVGTYGDELFADYFRAYKRELIADFGRGGAKKPVTGTAVVVPLAEYTREQIRC